VIKKLSVKNFKSLKDISLDFAPITLLVGENNTGKSSALQILLLLKQSLENRELPLDFNGRIVDLGGLGEVITDKDVWNNYLEINTVFEEYDFLLQVDAKYGTLRIRKFQIRSSRNQFSYSITKGRHGVSCEFNNWRITSKLKDLIIWNSFLVEEQNLWDSYRELARLLSNFNRKIKDYLRHKVHYLGPLMEYPHRKYEIKQPPEDVGFRGEQMPAVLYFADKKGKDELLSKIRETTEKIKLVNDIRFTELYHGTYSCEVLVSGNRWVNLLDVGFGISQILPIIVQGFFMPKGSTLLLEQPEIHLHPRLQAELGTILAEIANQGKTVIVETHSEHIILRLQRLVAQRILRPEDVAIYFFSIKENGYTEVQRIGVDELGQLESWPEGFFETDLKELDAYMDDIFERRKNEKSSNSGRGH